MNVTIRSGEVSAALLYSKTYLNLTGIPSTTVTTTGSTQPDRVSKPILKQLSDFLDRGDTHGIGLSSEKDASEIVVHLPDTTEKLTDRLLATLPLLHYDLLEHVVADLQLQLSFLIAKGVSVYALTAQDVYAVEVEPEHWRYVLLTESTSLKGGSTSAFLSFLKAYVGPQYVSTKLHAYMKRLELESEAEWI